jgi:cytochrome c oxidase subunit 2
VIGKALRTFGIAALTAVLPAVALAQDAGTAAQEPGHPEPGQIGLQPSVTTIMDSIHSFHNGILLWTAGLIVLLVLVLLILVMVRFNAKANPTPSKTTHNTAIEVIWTVVPIIILVVIAIPSFGVLTDQLTVPDGERKYLGTNIFSFGEVEVPAPAVTVKVTGQQWNWDYEYIDVDGAAPAAPLKFNSAMLSEEERLAISEANRPPRLLGVNYYLVVPVDTTVRVQVTADATGVIHAFAMPSFGIKIDAVPGRLNETWFNARKEGVYYGQCSELCGTDHAFMPIGIRVVSKEQFALWYKTFGEGFVDDANDTLPPLEPLAHHT